MLLIKYNFLEKNNTFAVHNWFAARADFWTCKWSSRNKE